jgi:hypothetical protein
MRYVALIDHKTQAAYNATNDSHHQKPCNVPTWFIPLKTDPRGNAVIPHGWTELHRFDAGDEAAARRHYETLRQTGCPRDPAVVSNADGDAVPGARTWHYRGDFHHARRMLEPFGLPPNTDRAVTADEHFRRINILMGQLCGAYHKLRRENGVAVMQPREREEIRRALAKVEDIVAIAHLVAAAIADAVDPAYVAFGIPNGRRFRVVVLPDPAEAATPPADPPAPDDIPAPSPESGPQKRPHNKPAVAAK